MQGAIRAGILALSAIAAAACDGGSPGAANEATAASAPIEWRVYQDTLERRRVVTTPAGGATVRLLQAPAFVRLDDGGRLATDPARPMPLGRHRLLVAIGVDGERRRVVVDLHVMPVV